MRRTAFLAAVVLAAAAACGGGGDEPKARPTATRSAAPPSPLAMKLRGQVVSTLAQCPCNFTLKLRGKGDKDRTIGITLRGNYDPTLKSALMDNVGGGVIRMIAVDGRTYIATYETQKFAGGWIELDLARVPSAVKHETALTLLAAADPSMAFALASSVTGEPRLVADQVGAGVPSRYEADFDLAVAARAAGLSAENVRRLVPEGLAHGVVVFNLKGQLVRVEISSAGPKGSTEDPVATMLTVDGIKVTGAKPAHAPLVKRVVDAVEGFPKT